MKVGIATVHDSSNMGSFLQAFALQEVIKENGDTPYIIKTRSRFATLFLYLGYNFAPSARSVRSFLKFILKSITHPKMTAEKYKKYKIYQKDWSCFERIIPVRKANKIGLDVLLLGSDEIWNVEQPAFQNPLFYGIGIDATRKYGYAISVGRASAEKLKAYSHLVNGIRLLQGILIRDNHTREVLKQNQIQISDRICDPTLQVDIKKYMRKKEDTNIPKKDYMVIYSYAIDTDTEKKLRRFAREHQLFTVAVSLPQTWCDEYINCGPLDFGAILSGAKYVYTTTFHGTIFSILYHTQFVSCPINQKVKDVLELLGTVTYQVTPNCSYEELEEKLCMYHDYEKVEKRIEDLRLESRNLYQMYVKGENCPDANL